VPYILIVGRLLLQQPTFAVHGYEPWGLVPAVVFCSGLLLLAGAGLEGAVRGAVKALRPLAAMCLVAALPLAGIKYPWMPATVRETVASYHEPYPEGSASYLADRRRLFIEWHLATGLYVLGTASLVGLWSIATQRASRRLQVALWILAGVTGMGVTAFERRKTRSDRKSPYAIMAFWLPLAITGISIVGLTLTVGLRYEKPPNNGLEGTGRE